MQRKLVQASRRRQHLIFLGLSCSLLTDWFVVTCVLSEHEEAGFQDRLVGRESRQRATLLDAAVFQLYRKRGLT